MHPDTPPIPSHPARRGAVRWTLRDPQGRQVTVDNLQQWARGHCDLFGMPESERSAVTIAVGLRNLKRSREGKLHRKDGHPYTVAAYKGWTLVGWEELGPGPSAHSAR